MSWDKEEHTLRVTNEYGRAIDVYDDGFPGDPWWIYGHEYGPTMIIRASSFEDAYGTAIDESPTIDASEIPEAYGFDGWCSGGYETTEKEYSPETAKARFDAAIAEAELTGNYPELLEGYQYQSNSTGTGIVNVGHYEWLEPFTKDTAKRFELVVEEIPWGEQCLTR